jgi:hypothetical protein
VCVAGGGGDVMSQLGTTLDLLRVRAIAVRTERLRRLGDDPHPDCCLRIDTLPAGVSRPQPAVPLLDPKDTFESPPRITADLTLMTLAQPHLSITVPESPARTPSSISTPIGVLPSPLRVRKSPSRYVVSLPVCPCVFVLSLAVSVSFLSQCVHPFAVSATHAHCCTRDSCRITSIWCVFPVRWQHSTCE